MERSVEKRIYSCNNCPIKPGRICTDYKSGRTRLIFDPLKTPLPSGQVLKPAYEKLESIYDCWRSLGRIKDDIPENVAEANDLILSKA